MAIHALRAGWLKSAALGCSLLALAACAAQTPVPDAEASSRSGLVDIFTLDLAPEGTPLPRFEVDAAWPDLPDDYMLGQVSGIAVGPDDSVWLTQRPHSLGATDNGLAQTPPIAACCKPFPPVVRFSKDGKFMSAFGGAGDAPTIDGVNQWAKSTHGLFVDSAGTVWVGGNGDGDHAVLNYTADGKFIRQFGRREATGGNSDTALLGNPADIHHDAKAGQVLIADGYINKRVIEYAGQDGAYRKLWGAYGEAPDASVREGNFDQSQATSTTDGGANPESRRFGDIVHCIVKSDDGLLFVCDRRNNRVQIFRDKADGTGVEFVRNLPVAPETGGTRTATDVALSPDGKFIYVADMMNGRIWILDRKTYQFLGAIGRNGRYPGEFIWLHSIDVDSEGNIYTSEVNTGRRVQKLVLTGVQ